MENQAMAMMSCSLDNNLNVTQANNNALYVGNIPTGRITAWNFYTDYYYPQTIIPSYPVYLQDRAKDKGKQAFEIVKILKDKKLVQLDKVADFIDLMDELIKIL